MGLFQSAPVQPSEPFPLSNDSIISLKDNRKLAFQTCGVTLDYETKDTPLVLAFHGALGTGDFTLWNPLFVRLGWRVVSPTIPGWGQSSPHVGRKLDDFPRDVEQMLSALGIDPSRKFIAIGISYGCVHALSCAMHMPDLVSNLLLLGPHAPFDDPNLDPLKDMHFASSFGLGKVANSLPFLGRMAGDYVRNSTSTPAKARVFVEKNVIAQLTVVERDQFEAASPALRNKLLSGEGMHYALAQSTVGYVEIPQVLRSWKSADLAKIMCHVHIFVGAQDNITPRAGATYFMQKIQKSTLSIIEGGHFSLILMFESCIERFVKETLTQA